MKNRILVGLILLCNSAALFSQTTITLEKSTSGIFYIPCEVNSVPMKFIFDPGASDVSISLKEAEYMYDKGYLLPSDIVGVSLYSDATGRISEGITILLKTIKIGDLILQNVNASIVKSMTAPLLFGQSALRKLGKYEFDYEKNTLTIKGKRKLNFLDFNLLNYDPSKKYYAYTYDIDTSTILTSIGKLKKETNVYAKPYSDAVIFKLKPNEEITRLRVEKHIYQMVTLRIMSFARPNDFDDCSNDHLKVGDVVYMLRNHGEGSHEVIFNKKIIFINAFYDLDHQGMQEGGYEGCNNITGKFIESKEISIIWIKIKTKNGKTGYLKNPQFNDFASNYCFPELSYRMTEGL